MNGHVAHGTNSPETKSDRTRLHERPTVSVAELAALQRGYVDRLGKLIEQLAAVMSRSEPPTAAIGSPAPARAQDRADRGRVAADGQLGTLTRTAFPDGSTSYELRTDLVRSTVAKVLGTPRPAFVERGASTNSPYLELVGTRDREIAAAMAYAAQRWGNDEVIIHVGGQHTGKIIEHAVAYGLNVANRDAYIQSLVAKERVRKLHPAARRLPAGAAPETIAVIERAASATHRAR